MSKPNCRASSKIRTSADTSSRAGRHHASRRWALAFVGALCVLASVGCGKSAPPQPPLTKSPVRPNQLAVTQVGDLLRLGWLSPHLDLRESSTGSVQRADVFRVRQQRDAQPLAFPDEFEEAADLIGFIEYDSLKTQLQQGDRVTYDDRLDLTQSSALSNTRFQYAVRYVDRRGRPLAWSNIVTIEPVPGIAEPPTDLSATQQQDRVVVAWNAPSKNIDGSTPAQIVGFNIYRAKPNAVGFGRPLNERPLTDPTFTDKNFLYLTPYIYVVRSVSQGPDQLVESSDSARLDVTPRDTFPPSQPTNVTAASAGGVVSLFWPTNPEPDVVGYFIYRAESGAATFTRITEKPVTRTTYRDEKVRTGSRYAYRLSAVDRYGNESPQTDPVEETASP